MGCVATEQAETCPALTENANAATAVNALKRRVRLLISKNNFGHSTKVFLLTAENNEVNAS
jgi:hypothetical protein